MRLVVIGLGNELLGDDSAGLRVIDNISHNHFENVDFKRCYSTGFEIMEQIEGYDIAIIIDSICTGLHKMGEIVQIEPSKVKYSKRMASFHDFDLFTAIELGKRLNLKMPKEIIIYGIEIEETMDFTEDISLDVKRAIDRLSDIVKNDIRRFGFLEKCELNGGIING